LTVEAPAVSDAARRSMTPQDITRIVWVSDPQISPDGSRVAFVATTLSEEKDEYLSQIWLTATNGGPPRRFTAGPKRDTEPRWSPDGQRLAFVSEREAKKKGQLYLIRVDGGEPVKLTDLKAGVTNPVWAPDGTRLCVVSRVGGWEEPDDEEEEIQTSPQAEEAGFSEGGGLLRGPGTGQSDEIEGTTPSGRPVLLSDGEYVIDAPTVAALGDGSTDAGARRLDALRKQIRQSTYGSDKQAKPMAKGKGGALVLRIP